MVVNLNNRILEIVRNYVEIRGLLQLKTDKYYPHQFLVYHLGGVYSKLKLKLKPRLSDIELFYVVKYKNNEVIIIKKL